MAVYAAGKGWRWLSRVRAAGLVLAVAAGALSWGAAAAQASAYPGTLRLAVTKVVAGTTGYPLGWTYQAPLRHKVTGTISLDVPAGFTAPQAGAAGSPGYVSTASACARFAVTGTAPQPDGSTLVSITVRCAAQQTGAISYTGVTVPTAAARYAFAATFTPAGSAAVPFAQADTVTVAAGAVARLVITPGSVQIGPGDSQAYTVQGFDAYGNPRGDVTAGTQFAISPDGSCTGNVCTAASFGPHTVTATKNHVTATAALLVAQADLAVTQTVDNSTPYYYAPVTFTTTVTNTGTTSNSTGVTATVNEPAAVVSPTATPSGSTSYDPATGIWTIGTLAPGASATLTITGYAGDVSAGTQTVTATVTADTPDPNPANNTAAASEASQVAPLQAVITPDPGNPKAVNVCAAPPDTITWYGSAVNAINPAAPPPTPGSFTYTWTCESGAPIDCPTPVNDTANSPYISYDSTTFEVDVTYNIYLTITPLSSDPNYQRPPDEPVSAQVTFTTTCIP